MKKPTIVESTKLHSGRIVELFNKKLRYGNGRLYDMDLISHPGAAAVVPVDGAGRVGLVRQYRLAVDDFVWEIPAGKLDPGEAPERCALRELREETGVVANRWTSLGLYVPAPGIYTEIIHLYLARELVVGAAQPDSDEELELQWLPLDAAVDKVLSGEWNDGKTVVALLRARHQMQL